MRTKENFKITYLPNNLIKYEFYESNPPYNRGVLDVKINNINKLMGTRGINLDKIIKDKSYFCLLWSPGDTNKNNSSFLSYYSFVFKLLEVWSLKKTKINGSQLLVSIQVFIKISKKII